MNTLDQVKELLNNTAAAMPTTLVELTNWTIFIDSCAIVICLAVLAVSIWGGIKLSKNDYPELAFPIWGISLVSLIILIAAAFELIQCIFFPRAFLLHYLLGSI